VPRFSPNPNRPEHLVASIVALAEQSNRVALESAMEAVRTDALGKVSSVVEQVCRLAVSSGVATGEISWLVAELEASQPTADQVGEVTVAVSGMQNCMSAVAFTIGKIAARGGPAEITTSAEALVRVAAQLEDLLNRKTKR
jgi:methyl-accepting chemotaxis protein